MAEDPTVVVALDCLDHRLVERWGLGGFDLGISGRLESHTWGTDYPHTDHIWPHVAMGIEPDPSDGVTWEHPLLDALATLATPVPKSIRTAIGRWLIGRGHGTDTMRIPTYGDEHLFDTVIQWPGIENETVQEAWNLTKAVHYDGLDVDEAKRRIRSNDVDSLRSAAEAEGVVGVHVHYLDVCGHLHARQEDALRAAYESMEEEIGALAETVGSMVVLSDHGMRVGWLDTPPIGQHSFEGYISVTDDWPEPLPAAVTEAHEYLKYNAGAAPTNGAPTELLKDLGYF